MWVQNKTQGYKGVSVENFGKDFRDGMALCALVHKHRPKLIDFDSLNPVSIFIFFFNFLIIYLFIFLKNRQMEKKIFKLL